MRTPVVLVAGIDATAMELVTLGLQFGLPGTVTVHHSIDAEREVLTRTVSDLSGVVEQEEILLAHTCVTCAIREDVLPTLDRLARTGRWSSILAHLPATAEPAQLYAALAWDLQLARRLRVASVVAALSAQAVTEDLIGQDLLAGRGLQVAPDDRRGVGEVLCTMVESADLILLDNEPDPIGRDLLATLARPDAEIHLGGHAMTAEDLLGQRHNLARTDAWTSPLRDSEPQPVPYGIWQVDLRTPRSMNPQRLLDNLEALGTGLHRSRGCFWLPTRADTAIEWDGAGGQVSIGQHSWWGRQKSFSRIIWTGVGAAPEGLTDAFQEAVSRPDDARAHSFGDGFEPWLGPIEEVA